jgi:hypothetical protein
MNIDSTENKTQNNNKYINIKIKINTKTIKIIKEMIRNQKDPSKV